MVTHSDTALLALTGVLVLVAALVDDRYRFRRAGKRHHVEAWLRGWRWRRQAR